MRKDKKDDETASGNPYSGLDRSAVMQEVQFTFLFFLFLKFLDSYF